MTESTSYALDACPPADLPPFRLFRMTVSAIEDLTPSIRRFTFRGEDVEHFGDPGLDQRIKVILPAGGEAVGSATRTLPSASRLGPDSRCATATHQETASTFTTASTSPPNGGGAQMLDLNATAWAWASSLWDTPDWYGTWRAMDPSTRPVIRTYTTRAVRYERGEVDVDMVVHPPLRVAHGEPAYEGEHVKAAGGELEGLGPAARWIRHARVGDEAMILGRNRYFVGDCGGQDFIAPALTEAFLIGGDETAAPAIARMMEELPASARGVAVVELPSDADCSYLPTHPGIEVRVFGRGDRPHGERLVAEVMRAAAELSPPGVAHEVEEIDIDHDILWEVPRHAKGGAALKRASLYTWLAGEAGAVKTLRRHLVAERGMDRRSVAFMGYWRLGRAEC